MNGKTALTLNLAAQMRARELVEARQMAMRLGTAELEHANNLVSSYRLGEINSTVASSIDLLGEPYARVYADEPDAAWSLAIDYQLDWWPQLLFRIEADQRGLIVATGFRSMQRHVPPHSPADLLPWKLAENQMRATALSLEVVDEWFPMKDYIVTMPAGWPERRWLLRFDFGLLQCVERP